MSGLRVAVSAVLLLFASAPPFAQSDPNAPPAQRSGARTAFELLKTLAGRWKGTSRIAVPAPDSFPVEVSWRVTSGGDALMHEMTPEGRSNDPARGDDDPVTMFYLDGDRLLLTHYCDNGKNRPRMTATLLSRTKTVEFDFLDLSGETQRGHMHHAVFSIVDADHHTENWTYVMPNGTPSVAHIELARAK